MVSVVGPFAIHVSKVCDQPLASISFVMPMVMFNSNMMNLEDFPCSRIDPVMGIKQLIELKSQNYTKAYNIGQHKRNCPFVALMGLAEDSSETNNTFS
ncbi:hypothetical protein PanWU01x14_269580 [Parasponia andersonii]|uniref:Uncharacterized protein n=1 Tax=Parasponia andersonii TaxID=3476 RepID=A0A2P5B5F3_PARAD|nr:hypothetical protein PanWU01x14_269580 [Parasponia andersonii]